MALGTALTIGSILARLGQGYFAGRDLESAQREQDRRVGYSNLINTFGGRSIPSPVQRRPGTATTILGGLGTALGAGADIYGSLRADKLADLQMEKLQGDITRQGVVTKAAEGELARGGRQRSVDFGKRLGTELGTGALTAALPATEESLFTSRPPRQVTTTLAETAPPDVLLGASQGMRARELSDAQLRKTLAEAGRLEAQGRSYEYEAPLKRITESVALATPVVTNAANSGATWQEVTASPLMGQIDIRSTEILKSLFENTKRVRVERQNKELADFLYGDLSRKFNSDELLKKSGDLIFGMNLMAEGWDRQNGVGDLMMTNAMVRLSDPGVSVRPMEALQMEEVGGKLEEWKIIVTGEKFLEGDKFTLPVRKRLLEAAQGLYGGQIRQINDKLGREAKAAGTRVMDLTGRSDPGQVPMFIDFLDTYRLSDLSTYNIDPNKASTLVSRIGVPSGFQGGPYVPATGQGGGYMGSPVGPLPAVDFNFWREQRRRVQ